MNHHCVTIASHPRCRCLTLVLLLGGVFGFTAAAEDRDGAARHGSVQLSDGTIWTGAIALVPGTSLLLHEGTTAHTIDFSQVSILALHGEKEHMERNFLMPEAGKAFREEYGDPYPVRELGASITMADGSVHSGHLQTTALVVDCPAASGNAEDPPERHKVMLAAKQQGKPGQTLNALVFATSIRFLDHVAVRISAAAIHLAGDDALELAVLTREDLAAIAMTRTAAGTFSAEIPLVSAPFLAARSAQRVEVAWPDQQTDGVTPEVRQALEKGLVDAEDFFDDRKLLGVWQAPESTQAFTLVRLYRRAQSVDGVHPWDVEIWRWHIDEDQHVMLAGRGKFFRDVAPSDDKVPQVTLRPAWWSMHLVDQVWVIPGSQR